MGRRWESAGPTQQDDLPDEHNRMNFPSGKFEWGVKAAMSEKRQKV